MDRRIGEGSAPGLGLPQTPSGKKKKLTLREWLGLGSINPSWILQPLFLCTLYLDVVLTADSSCIWVGKALSGVTIVICPSKAREQRTHSEDLGLALLELDCTFAPLGEILKNVDAGAYASRVIWLV